LDARLAVMGFTIVNGRIIDIDAITNPERVARLVALAATSH
jgi:hypothetical protein